MSRFKHLQRLECAHLISNSEFNCAFITYSNSLKELSITGNYEYNFYRVFTHQNLPVLTKLCITDMDRNIGDLDVKAIAFAAPNLTHIDFSGTPSMTAELLEPMLEIVGSTLRVLKLLRRTNITNDILV
jgi:hypothetical protein